MARIWRNFEAIVASVAFAAMLIVVTANVGMRYLLGKSIGVTEEVAYLGFVYAVFMGASLLYKKHALIAVGFIVELFPPRARRGLFVIDFSLLALTNAYMAYLTVVLALGSLDKRTPFIEMPYIVMYVPVFLSFCLMAVYSVNFAIKEIRGESARFAFIADQY